LITKVTVVSDKTISALL